MNYLFKVIISAVIIVAINEIAQINVSLGALIKALPLISVISFIWLYYSSGGDTQLLSKLSADTFWLVLPTLPLFPVFAYLLSHTKLGFFVSLTLSVCVMFVCYFVTLKLLKYFGIHL
jgi:hypothetical protein